MDNDLPDFIAASPFRIMPAGLLMQFYTVNLLVYSPSDPPVSFRI